MFLKPSRVFAMLLTLASILANFSVNVIAQTESARISGVVTDPSGAVVIEAEVILTNVEQGTSTTAITNRVGVYVLPGVRPGQYRMSARKTGFKTVDVLGVIVNVQDRLEENFHLQPGSVTESITVSGGAPLVNTEDATVSTVVDRHFQENLPLNGRSFQSLIQLAPGVVVTPSNSFDGGQFSVNGQRAASNYWMVDGVSANIGIGTTGFAGGNGFSGALGSFGAQGGTNSLVSVDALQEFRIQTSTFAPEFGRTPGAQISIVTRSGANGFHGTAFDYVRNDMLDANDWFANHAHLPKPKERQNDFGGTFSGPIIKNNTFFFFSYEGLRLRLPQVALTTVPCDSTCTVASNVRAAATPGVQPYLNAFPLPNGPEVIDPVSGAATGSAEFNASFSNSSSLNAYSLRLDHDFSSAIRLFGRYDYSPSELTERGSPLAFEYPVSDLTSTRIVTQTATAGLTWVLSHKTVDEFRFNFSRVNANGSQRVDNFGGAIPLTTSPFPAPFTSGDSYFALDVFSLTNGFLGFGKMSANEQKQINLVNNISAQKGLHTLKLGVDFRRLSPYSSADRYLQEPFFFDMSSFAAGNPDGGVNLSATQPAGVAFNDLSLFAQDTWKIQPRFSLTYGVRWDVEFAPSSTSAPNLLALNDYRISDLSTIAIAPPGSPIFHTRYGNLAPRVGAAYQIATNPDWQTVLRGGFGVFYDFATSELGNLINQGYPFTANRRISSNIFPLDALTATPPPITTDSFTTPGGILAGVNPRLNLPYALEWNVALEQSLGRQQTLTATYVGSAGRRLLQTAFVFAPNPSFSNADLVSNSANSQYNALQLQLQRPLTRGLQALASYTWSHSIDDASAGSYNNGNNTAVPGLDPSASRGPSSFDIRHSFSGAMTYQVPVINANVATRAILGGWSLQSILLARSAAPLDLSNLFSGILNNAVATVRPDLVPGQPLYLEGPQYPGGRALNPAAFVSPPTDVNGNPLRQGNLGRNALRGFGATQWDFAVHRDFPIHEAVKLQFRAEMFNVLNHPNFGAPNAKVGSRTFGVAKQMLNQSLNSNNSGGGAFDPLYQIGGPRSIQMALKLFF